MWAWGLSNLEQHILGEKEGPYRLLVVGKQAGHQGERGLLGFVGGGLSLGAGAMPPRESKSKQRESEHSAVCPAGDLARLSGLSGVGQAATSGKN